VSHATRRTSTLNAALLVATGAAAGVALGMFLARRPGGKRTIANRMLGLLEGVERWTNVLVPVVAPVADDAEADERDDEENLARADNDGDEYADEAIEYEDDEDDDEYDVDDIEYADDEARVDERVLAAFEQDPILSQRAIEIDEPRPATIVLSGRVSSRSDAAHAAIIARGTPGVETVVNRLQYRR
jgi:hypothetical protein